MWAQVYSAMGMTEQELDAHFAGAAFLAWGRMGNIRGWGGPLDADWREQQMQLQLQILERERSLGMIAVLPAFAGHVPEALTRIYPNANVTRSPDWGGFNDTYGRDFLLQVRRRDSSCKVPRVHA